MVPRWALAVFAVCGVLIGAVLGNRIGERVDQSEVVAVVAEAIETNCEQDRAYREQAKVRAVAERASIVKQIAANEALIEVANAFPEQPPLQELGVKLDRYNRKLVKRLQSIRVVPLPRCDEEREAVEALR